VPNLRLDRPMARVSLESADRIFYCLATTYKLQMLYRTERNGKMIMNGKPESD
jgi:hypothetical protein